MGTSIYSANDIIPVTDFNCLVGDAMKTQDLFGSFFDRKNKRLISWVTR